VASRSTLGQSVAAVPTGRHVLKKVVFTRQRNRERGIDRVEKKERHTDRTDVCSFIGEQHTLIKRCPTLPTILLAVPSPRFSLTTPRMQSSLDSGTLLQFGCNNRLGVEYPAGQSFLAHSFTYKTGGPICRCTGDGHKV